MKKKFTSSDKAQIALEALKEVNPLSKRGSAHGANPIQVGLWKKTLLTRCHELFDRTNSEARIITSLKEERDELHRIVGVREAELVWLKKNLPRSAGDRKLLADRDHESIPFTRQAELLDVARSTL